jgi:Uma2 family endonuclease
MSTIAKAITTADELLRTPGLGRCELVRGELIEMSPSGYAHGRLAAEIARILCDFVNPHHLGAVTGAETGFIIERNPDTVRAPDAGFIRADRAPSKNHRGFVEGPPDLAVEVRSPGDRTIEVVAKVHAWLSASCQTVWVVEPETETITVHQKNGEILALSKTDTLCGGDVLPGFSVPVRDVFGE